MNSHNWYLCLGSLLQAVAIIVSLIYRHNQVTQNAILHPTYLH